MTIDPQERDRATVPPPPPLPPSKARTAMQGVRQRFPAIVSWRKSGLSWVEIAEKLFQHGIATREGQPLSVTALRSAFFQIGIESGFERLADVAPAGTTPTTPPPPATGAEEILAHAPEIAAVTDTILPLAPSAEAALPSPLLPDAAATVSAPVSAPIVPPLAPPSPPQSTEAIVLAAPPAAAAQDWLAPTRLHMAAPAPPPQPSQPEPASAVMMVPPPPSPAVLTPSSTPLTVPHPNTPIAAADDWLSTRPPSAPHAVTLPDTVSPPEDEAQEVVDTSLASSSEPEWTGAEPAAPTPATEAAPASPTPSRPTATVAVIVNAADSSRPPLWTPPASPVPASVTADAAADASPAPPPPAPVKGSVDWFRRAWDPTPTPVPVLRPTATGVTPAPVRSPVVAPNRLATHQVEPDRVEKTAPPPPPPAPSPPTFVAPPVPRVVPSPPHLPVAPVAGVASSGLASGQRHKLSPDVALKLDWTSRGAG